MSDRSTKSLVSRFILSDNLSQAVYPELRYDFGGKMEVRTTSNESFVEDVNKLCIFEFSATL
jgi:hypothetical protein